MDTPELTRLLQGCGYSVHGMNTIAVALSVLKEEFAIVPKGLEISWKSSNLENSKRIARNFAEKSAYVYVAEMLFDYLQNISKNPLWEGQKFAENGNESKASKTYNFLSQFPTIVEEDAILSEMLCHWRNRVVHFKSNARISSKKQDFLIEKEKEIFENRHHFSVKLALKNFEEKKVTLKDVSTLTTIVISCCRSVDKYFLQKVAAIEDFSKYKDLLLNDEEFASLEKQEQSPKRSRQLKKWIELNYPFLPELKVSKILNMFDENI